MELESLDPAHSGWPLSRSGPLARWAARPAGAGAGSERDHPSYPRGSVRPRLGGFYSRGTGTVRLGPAESTAGVTVTVNNYHERAEPASANLKPGPGPCQAAVPR